MARSVFLLLFCLGTCAVSHAQATDSKTPLVFECQCSDAVGEQYATAFRDLVASSPRYRLTSQATVRDAGGKVLSVNWHVIAVSLDPSLDHDGRSSVISLVLLIGDDIYVSQDAIWCPARTINEGASRALAFIDGYAYSPSK